MMASTMYLLSDEDWRNKPMMWNTMFQYLYFINALSNGNIVAENNITEKVQKAFLWIYPKNMCGFRMITSRGLTT